MLMGGTSFRCLKHHGRRDIEKVSITNRYCFAFLRNTLQVEAMEAAEVTSEVGGGDLVRWTPRGWGDCVRPLLVDETFR